MKTRKEKVEAVPIGQINEKPKVMQMTKKEWQDYEKECHEHGMLTDGEYEHEEYLKALGEQVYGLMEKSKRQNEKTRKFFQRPCMEL